MAKKSENYTGKYSPLEFECEVCFRVYKKPGICDVCKVILKPKGG